VVWVRVRKGRAGSFALLRMTAGFGRDWLSSAQLALGGFGGVEEELTTASAKAKYGGLSTSASPSVEMTGFWWGERHKQKQIPPLRCGMTTKEVLEGLRVRVRKGRAGSFAASAYGCGFLF